MSEEQDTQETHGQGSLPPQKEESFDLSTMLQKNKGSSMTDIALIMLVSGQQEDRAWRREQAEQRRQTEERREQRETAREERESKEKALTAEEIRVIVSEETKKITPPTDSPAVTALTEKLNNVAARLEEKDKEDRDAKLIAAATEPLQKRLDELAERIKNEPKGQPEAQRTELDTYIEYRGKLRTAGILQEQQNPTAPLSFGEDEIPVSGSIPAWAVYIPKVANMVMVEIQKVADRFGLKPVEGTEPSSMINLPPRPDAQQRYLHISPPPGVTPPPPQTIKPPPNTPPSTSPPTQPQQPAEEIIKLPERPPPPAPTETPDTAAPPQQPANTETKTEPEKGDTEPTKGKEKKREPKK